MLPAICPTSTRQVTAVVGAILVVKRQLKACSWLRDTAVGGGLEGGKDAWELQTCREAYLLSITLCHIAGIHILIADTQSHIEGLSTTKDIAIRVAESNTQAVECRGCRCLQLHLHTLLESGCAVDIALQVALASVEQLATVLLAYIGNEAILIG